VKKLLFSLFCVSLMAQQRPDDATVKQWQARKFGMFIHFGLYSELGGVWQGKQYSGNYSEQIQSDAHIPEAEYQKLAASFNPAKWDPDAVVQLAIDAGMKFIVITSKHHDGFNMFGTQQSSYNIVDGTPYKRDVVKSLAEACRKRNLPFGVYYSTIDWHYGDIPQYNNDNHLTPEHEAFNVAQLRELMSGYGPISEIWFDMGHPMPLQSRHFADTVHSLQPQCLISGRVWNSEGDFSETGDDSIPDYVSDEPWESPASIFAETWGYRSWQKRVPVDDKIHEQILRLVKVTSRGGNYILNIGPRGDGSVVDYEAEVLRGTGQWLKQYGQAIYDTNPQPFRKLDFGYATVKGNQLYLFVEHPPVGGQLRLPGMQNRLLNAHWLGLDQSLSVSDGAVSAGSLPGGQFLPVAVVNFEGKLNVLQPAVQPGADQSVHLVSEAADRFYNSNGEGYWDGPTLRREEWHFAVKRAGKYQISMVYKPGHFSRLLEVHVGGTVLNLNVYGDDKQHPATAVVELAASKDTLLSVTPAAPRERGAAIDFDIQQVVITPQ